MKCVQLSICIKEEMCYFIRVLHLEWIKPVQIIGWMQQQNIASCLLCSEIYQWTDQIEHLNNGQTCPFVIMTIINMKDWSKHLGHWGHDSRSLHVILYKITHTLDGRVQSCMILKIFKMCVWCLMGTKRIVRTQNKSKIIIWNVIIEDNECLSHNIYNIQQWNLGSWWTGKPSTKYGM